MTKKYLVTEERPANYHPEPQPQGPFLIEIDESQRAAIISALTRAVLTPNGPLDRECYEELLDMFKDLPNSNTKDLIHGFCI